MKTANIWEYKVGINANIANFFVFVKMSNTEERTEKMKARFGVESNSLFSVTPGRETINSSGLGITFRVGNKMCQTLSNDTCSRINVDLVKFWKPICKLILKYDLWWPGKFIEAFSTCSRREIQFPYRTKPRYRDSTQCRELRTRL